MLVRRTAVGLAFACATLSYAAPLPTAVAEEPSSNTLRQAPDSRNQIVKFTDTGIEPKVLTTNKSDSIVFFLNATSDSLTTIEIDFGPKRMHCASSTLKLGEDGKIRSVAPFGPRSFTSACFPDPGSYPVTVYGLNGKASGVSSTIKVE